MLNIVRNKIHVRVLTKLLSKYRKLEFELTTLQKGFKKKEDFSLLEKTVIMLFSTLEYIVYFSLKTKLLYVQFFFIYGSMYLLWYHELKLFVLFHLKKQFHFYYHLECGYLQTLFTIVPTRIQQDKYFEENHFDRGTSR